MKVLEQRFDPITGLPMKAAPPAINTRTMLFHKTRPAIVVEGKGATDTEKRADVAAQIERAIKRDGYSLTRFDGQHPHSNDDHRLDMQRRAAEGGDKGAAASLKAKASQVPEVAVSPEVEALTKQLAELEAQVAKLTPKA